MICKHCANESDLILSGEGFCHEHMSLTAYVGKKRKIEQIKPGQIFALRGERYLKVEDAFMCIRLPDFKPVSDLGNYTDVYLLGELNII